MSATASSNSVPSYYPPGWDRQRAVNSTTAELRALPSEQLDTLREGLQADLGPEGFQEFLEEVQRNEDARCAAAAAAAAAAVTEVEDEGGSTQASPPYRPNFLRVLDRRYPSQPWGFVAFRTAAYDDSERWNSFKQRWNEMMMAQLEGYEEVSGMTSAKQNWNVQWVEDAALEGASIGEIATRYRALNVVPGLKHPVCLAITPSSLSSVLDTPFPLPSSTPLRERAQIPFVIAIDMYADEAEGNASASHSHSHSQQQTHHETSEGHLHNKNDEDGREDDFSAAAVGHFKVAVETLISELFVVVGDQLRSPAEIGAGYKENEVWCSLGRFGVHGR